MFSGKTEELLRLLKRAEFAKINYLLVKPETDTRGEKTIVASHSKRTKDCVVVKSANEIEQLAANFEYIAIDEAQFFDSNIVSVVENLARKGKRVVISGLDMDYLGKPFGPMPQLMAIADEVVKLHAICTECGAQAQFSKRITDKNQTVLIGAKESYTALCRTHFYA
jgi:thymidine kinase